MVIEKESVVGMSQLGEARCRALMMRLTRSWRRDGSSGIPVDGILTRS